MKLLNQILKEVHGKVCYMVLVVMTFWFTVLAGCSDSLLDEKPKDFLNSDVVLVDEEGFESAINALYMAARAIYFREDGTKMYSLQLGTDVALTGDRSLNDFQDYGTWLTPTQTSVQIYWNRLFLEMIPRANTIIMHANDGDAEWSGEEAKNRVVAEARFFRAYAHNFLVNLYGGIPIVDRIYDAPKTDFERNTREEVYNFVREDLEFASEWLPVEAPAEGRISKAAADHLLAEVYISLGQYENAIESASRIIDSGRYELMTQRFGNYTDEPGDVYADLFKDENQSRDVGNMEAIWSLQFAHNTPGGTADNSQWYANSWQRAWGPKWWELADPDGNEGMQLTTDSLGRGVAWLRPTDYVVYHIWNEDPDDMRNSRFNIQRDYYYNNPESDYFGQKVDPETVNADTMVQHYPTLHKITAQNFPEGASYGRAFKDTYVMRLAETYLLRAEAYVLNGNQQEAADDINTVRARANADPVDPSEVDLEYILDERARELVVEEPRRLTLNRMGRLVEQVRDHNSESAATVQEHHALYPIPQSAIDANTGATMQQNPGY